MISKPMKIIDISQELPDKEDRERKVFAVIAKGLLSKEQTQKIIDSCPQKNFTDKLEQDIQFRNGFRYMFDDHELSKELFNKIKDFVPQEWDTKQCCRPFINTDLCKSQSGMTLKLDYMNPRFRCLKYEKDQYFYPHIDGYYVQENFSKIEYCSRGILTLQIYLNKDYEGGSTKFISKDCKSSICLKDKCEYGCKDFEIEVGDAIIFQHDLLHQGSVIKSGTKYTCRTELMYKAERND